MGNSTAVRVSLRRLFAMAVVLSGVSPAMLGATSAGGQGTGPADTLQEIVVTATKSATNLRDVPIAIAAFTGAELRDQGVSSVNALGRFVPSVNLDTSTAFSGSRSVLSASIRGIGLDDFALNLDPAVGVYLDGVYLARTIGSFNRRDVQASVDVPFSDTLLSTFTFSSIKRNGHQTRIPYVSSTPYVSDSPYAFA